LFDNTFLTYPYFWLHSYIKKCSLHWNINSEECSTKWFGTNHQWTRAIVRNWKTGSNCCDVGLQAIVLTARFRKGSEHRTKNFVSTWCFFVRVVLGLIHTMLRQSGDRFKTLQTVNTEPINHFHNWVLKPYHFW